MKNSNRIFPQFSLCFGLPLIDVAMHDFDIQVDYRFSKYLFQRHTSMRCQWGHAQHNNNPLWKISVGKDENTATFALDCAEKWSQKINCDVRIYWKVDQLERRTIRLIKERQKYRWSDEETLICSEKKYEWKFVSRLWIWLLLQRSNFVDIKSNSIPHWFCTVNVQFFFSLRRQEQEKNLSWIHFYNSNMDKCDNVILSKELETINTVDVDDATTLNMVNNLLIFVIPFLRFSFDKLPFSFFDFFLRRNQQGCSMNRTSFILSIFLFIWRKIMFRLMSSITLDWVNFDTPIDELCKCATIKIKWSVFLYFSF